MPTIIKVQVPNDGVKYATTVWQAAVTKGEASDATVEEYLNRVIAPTLVDTVVTICNSWKPPEDPKVTQKRLDIAAKVQTIDASLLTGVEQALAPVAPTK